MHPRGPIDHANRETHTHQETFRRWTFTYYVRGRKGAFYAEADIHEGVAYRACFMLSESGTVPDMTQRLREFCEGWALDMEDPGRVERRNARTIGDQIKRGQAGEKGVR